MAYQYCTNEDILVKIGVTLGEISKERLNQIRKEAEKEVDRLIKTTSNPQIDIKILNGNNKSTMYMNKLPLLVVKELKISNTPVSIDKVRFNQYGAIKLLLNAEKTSFDLRFEPNVFVKYVFGWLEETTQRILQNTVGRGNVTMSLDSVEFLKVDDWVRVVGMDGFEEWTKIEGIDVSNKTITCDLVYSHEAGSLIHRGEVPELVKKLTAVIGAIMGGIYMIGNTYTFATSYSVPDHTVTKGVPYPHFVKVLDDLVKERDFLLREIPPFPVFA